MQPSITKPKRTWRDRLPVLFFLAVLPFGYFWFTRFKAPKKIDVASLQLANPNGQAIPAGSLQGKAVVLNFWAPWCGPCNLETPWLQALQNKHPDDLLVIGVDDDADTNDQIPEFAFRHGVHYPLVTRNAQIRHAVGTLAGVPTTLYIDRSGNVVHTITGAIPAPLMEQFAEDAINH